MSLKRQAVIIGIPVKTAPKQEPLKARVHHWAHKIRGTSSTPRFALSWPFPAAGLLSWEVEKVSSSSRLKSFLNWRKQGRDTNKKKENKYRWIREKRRPACSFDLELELSLSYYTVRPAACKTHLSALASQKKAIRPPEYVHVWLCMHSAWLTSTLAIPRRPSTAL